METANELTVADAQRRIEEMDRFYDACFGNQLWTWHDLHEVNPGDWDLFASLNQIIEDANGVDDG